jgi:metastasis-associated protein MTA
LNTGLPSASSTKRAHLSQQLHQKHTLEHPAPAVLPLAPPLNGRAIHPHPLPHGPPLSRSNARKQVISWMDAPDDVYFRATEQIKLVEKL